ncbi:MAG TPA: vWA domain-containing protein [Gaiellaceae bacterium]|nr:vWA domain-containing protein [Gaiellaceae bacterium]
MRRPGLPTVDLPALGGAVRRTTVLRAALVLALAAALAAETAVARGRDVRQAGFLPTGTNGMLVLDASKSVELHANRQIAALLERLAARNEPLGLVVFSDIAYELLPPGSPGRALGPLVRFFTPRVDSEGNQLVEDPFIANPWADAFSGGTQISAGLLTALDALRRDGVEHASLLLVSDLETAPSDQPRLTDALLRIRDEGVQVRILSLAPLEHSRQVFAAVLGPDVFIEPEEVGFVGGRIEQRLEGGSARPLVLAGCLVLLLLGAQERLLARVRVPEEAR